MLGASPFDSKILREDIFAHSMPVSCSSDEDLHRIVKQLQIVMAKRRGVLLQTVGLLF